MPDYLRSFPGTIDLNALAALKRERLTWRKRPGWRHRQEMLESLPETGASPARVDGGTVVIGESAKLSTESRERIGKAARTLTPWRKGPFELFGHTIDAEWRSDMKWNRIASRLPDLTGRFVLDVGCNNGYFMFRSAALGACQVLGIDPVVPFEDQFRLLQHFARCERLHFELFGIEHIKYFEQVFDIILHMGVIYHHPNPIGQLADVRRALRPKGRVLLESLGIPGEESLALIPPGRYANMRNVHAVPTCSALRSWLVRAGFSSVEVIDKTPASGEEQRSTPWCGTGHRSFGDFLDPANAARTIEGHPAPWRFCLQATK